MASIKKIECGCCYPELSEEEEAKYQAMLKLADEFSEFADRHRLSLATFKDGIGIQYDQHTMWGDIAHSELYSISNLHYIVHEIKSSQRQDVYETILSRLVSGYNK